jgi:hypothetical protein
MALHNKNPDDLLDGSDIGSPDAASGPEHVATASDPASGAPMPDREAIEAACRLQHDVAAAVCAISGISDCRLSLCSYGEDIAAGSKLSSKIAHFKVGQWQAMAGSAFEWTQERGRNVYWSHVVYEPGLRAMQRGKSEQALGVIGFCSDLDADKGNFFQINNLPLQPALVARTSTTPAAIPANLAAVNHQATHFLDRLVDVATAKIFTARLMQVVGDKDGGTGDPIHLWRVPGTLNWPKSSKINRRRPNEPQLVIVDNRGTGRTVSPEELASALGVDLKQGLADEMPEWNSAASSDRRTNEPREPRWSGDHHDLHSNLASIKIARIASALLAVSPDVDRGIWRGVVCGLCDHFMGSAVGYSLAAAWAGGGTCEGVTFPGCPPRYNEADQRQVWHDAMGRGDFSIGTVFFHAKQAGWNTSLTRWGLPREQRPAKSLTVAARGVQQAGWAMIETGADINQLRDAWVEEVAIRTGNQPDLIKVAIMAREFINGQSGIGFPGFDLLSETLEWGPAAGRDSYIRIQRSMRNLALAGFIILSPGNQRGAHGRMGPSFALTFPDGLTWNEALTRHQGRFRRSNMSCEHTSPDVSPDQIPVGSNTHHSVCVETTGGAVPHRPMCAYLSPDSVGGEGSGAKVSEVDRQAGEKTTQKLGDDIDQKRQSGRRPDRSLEVWLQTPAIPALLRDFVIDASSVAKPTIQLVRLAEKLNKASGLGHADSYLGQQLEFGARWATEPNSNGQTKTNPQVVGAMVDALTTFLGEQGIDHQEFHDLQMRRAKAQQRRQPTPSAATNNRYANAKAGEPVQVVELGHPPS